MSVIPLIVGFGGVNAAGRSSFNHSHNRMVVDALSQADQDKTWQSLRALTGRPDATPEQLANDSLIREIQRSYFDHNAVEWNRNVPFETQQNIIVNVSKKRMPVVLPDGWRVLADEGKNFSVEISGTTPAMFKDYLVGEVGSAGQVPSGFDPGVLYAARSHPRGLQLAIYSASDALGSLGLDWNTIAAKVAPDQVSVYSGSCMSQMDEDGYGGLFARRNGKRVTSKNLPLGLAQMPADFINAYVLGTMGTTGLVMGACATFHYNLRAAVQDINSGRAKVAIVGSAETGVTPETIDGFHTMGALGTKKGLMGLDGSDTPDYRRACRPFGDNCGFTIAEGAQTIVLMADDLAMELGAQVYGAVPEVYVNADGFKKSVSGPGVGNHITVAKGAGLVRAILGDKALQQRSYIHAHGTGTPQNRVTESQIMNQVATAFGIQDWPVAAIKCYVGHTLATAGGDQLISALGTWNNGIIPGISTIDGVADDVHQQNLLISKKHLQRSATDIDASLLNAKGFGGNNATSVVLSPTVCEGMLKRKHGDKAFAAWQHSREATVEAGQAFDQVQLQATTPVVYKFNHEVRDEEHVHIDASSLSVEGYVQSIKLDTESPLAIYTD